jgi:hypothetical protein
MAEKYRRFTLAALESTSSAAPKKVRDFARQKILTNPKVSCLNDFQHNRSIRPGPPYRRCMMHKWTISLAALVVATVLSSPGTKANMGIASLSFFSNSLNPPQLSIDAPSVFLPSSDSQFSIDETQTSVFPKDIDSNAFPTSTMIDPKKVELSMRPTGHFDAYPDFAVGENSLKAAHHPSDPMLWTAPPSSRSAEQWEFMQKLVLGPDFWDKVGDMFDVNDDERPWSTTTSVHVLAPTGNPFVPFATVAYEVDSIEVYDRIGLGGGAQISLSKNITLGADLVYFGDRLNETTSQETRAMARLEIQF